MNSMKNILLVTIGVFSILQGTTGTRCWQQICRECPKTAEDGPGTEVTCEFRNLVATSWLDSSTRSDVSANTNLPDPQFSCIKLTASSPEVVGDSTDVIRGCALKEEAGKICEALKTISTLNGKKSADCTVCDRDNCNGAAVQTATFLLTILSAFSVLKYFYS